MSVKYLPPSVVARMAAVSVSGMNNLRLHGQFVPPNLVTNLVHRMPQLGWDEMRVQRWTATYNNPPHHGLTDRVPRIPQVPGWWWAETVFAPSLQDIIGEHSPTTLNRVLRAAGRGDIPEPIGFVKRAYAWAPHHAPAVAEHCTGTPALPSRLRAVLDDPALMASFPEQWHLNQGKHPFTARVGDPRACRQCARTVWEHRAHATGPAGRAAQVRAEIAAARADLKNVVVDLEAFMYAPGTGGQLQAHVASADTNGPPADADTRAQAVRGHLGDLLDWLEATEDPQ